MEVTVDGENSGARVNEFMWSSGCCCRPGIGAIIERLSKYLVFIPSFCCFCWASLCGGPCEASSNKTAYCKTKMFYQTKLIQTINSNEVSTCCYFFFTVRQQKPG